MFIHWPMFLFPENFYANGGDKYSRDSIEL